MRDDRNTDYLDETESEEHGQLFQKLVKVFGRPEDAERRESFGLALPVKKMIYIGVVILIVLAAVFVITSVLRSWHYSNYRVISSDEQEDTSSATYRSLNGNIFRYGADGATLLNRQNEIIWSISYEFRDPEVSACNDVAVIYDQRGTSVIVCDETGQTGSFTTGYPIIKARVSSKGTVAALQEDGETTWIQYYDRTGSLIASIRTAMDDPGYPLDIGLSPDGEMISVTYLAFSEEGRKGIVHFYNFGKAGQNQMDNRVAEFEYSSKIVPEIDYMNNSVCVAFRENGFSLYKGTRIPEQSVQINVDSDIASVFYNSEYVGLVMNNDASDSFLVAVYDTNGKEMFREDLFLRYDRVEMVGDQINFYNGSDLTVYTVNGVEKFRGTYEGVPREFFALDEHRYVVLEENRLNLIKLD